MKRYFRPVAYSAILVLGLLAIFDGEPATVPAVDQDAPVATRPRQFASDQSVANLAWRTNEALPLELFATNAKVLVAPTSPAPTVAQTALPDIKVLGWMLADSKPYIFLDWSNENYTLSPGESVGDMYRFDTIGQGFADFTFLPTGEARRYTVSDPVSIE